MHTITNEKLTIDVLQSTTCELIALISMALRLQPVLQERI
jgi:hypothetical protein